MDPNVISFYFTDAPPPGDLFCTIAQELAKWEHGSSNFRYFDVDRNGRYNMVFENDGKLTLEELLKTARGRNDPACQLFTEARYWCWHDSDGKMEQANTAIDLYTRGVDYHNRGNADQRIHGLAELCVLVPPYNELLSSKNPRQAEINQYREKNLSALAEFLMNLARTVGASSMKIYRGDLFAMPLNASLAYYRDTQALLDDLRFISEIWEQGLPDYGLGALKDGDAEDLERVICDKRDHWSTISDWGERLLDDLKALLPIKAMPTEEDVDRVLQSERHDNYRYGESFTVLNYPFYMNGVLDRFYIEVLKQAAGMPLERPGDVYMDEGK